MITDTFVARLFVSHNEAEMYAVIDKIPEVYHASPPQNFLLGIKQPAGSDPDDTGCGWYWESGECVMMAFKLKKSDRCAYMILFK